MPEGNVIIFTSLKDLVKSLKGPSLVGQDGGDQLTGGLCVLSGQAFYHFVWRWKIFERSGAASLIGFQADGFF